MSVSAEITAPYNKLEAWTYDRLIAPSVTALLPAHAGDRLGHIAPGGRLLDVGCGGGQNLLSIGELRPDLDMIGLDLNPHQIARARRRSENTIAPPHFVQGSALELPFDDGEFDAVISVASIKHWPDKERGLAECVRVLRPGGWLMVVEADRSCYLADARRFVESWGLPKPLSIPALAMFRTWVAGQGIDLCDVRAFLDKLPLAESRGWHPPHTPAVVLEGTKA